MRGVIIETVNIVIDVGSSSIRAIAFTIKGEVIASAKKNYETFYPYPGWAEQDTRDWENATLNSLTELMQILPPGIKLNGLSVTGQCPSYVPVDKKIQPLGNAFTYQDNRALVESEYIVSEFGNEYIHKHSGHSVQPFYVLPKLLWHKNNNSTLFKKIHKVLQPCDYIEYFLTGNLFTDHAYACGTLAYDMETQHWNHTLLRQLEINENIFPDVILNSWDIAGEIKNEISERTGLPRNLQVIRGGPDSQCCSLGVAAIETNILSNMSGTSTCLNRTVMNPMEDLRVGNYAHVIPNCWSAEVGLNTTGLSLRKIAKIIFSDLSESSMYNQINTCVLQSPVGSNDLLYYPYLTNGERDNQNVKGGFYNLSMMSTKEDMIRAVMEGVAFAEKERADLLITSGELFSCMRISGGGASSDLWSQIKADVMNIPVYALKNVDAAELGTSMIVSVGTRAFPSFSDAVSECTLHYDEFIPNNKNISLYEDMYQEFIRVENALSR